MGVLATVSRVIELGGQRARAAQVLAMRSAFEARTGAFSPEDPWFEERSRAFWVDAATRGRFGREVAEDLREDERVWLAPIERAHRGLFRAEVRGDRRILVDVWGGAELAPTQVDDESAAELEASDGQLFDARVVGTSEPFAVTLLPGALFHPRHATTAIEPVLKAARAAALATHEALDALLRMERTLRALSRVKAAYAYRAEALAPPEAKAVSAGKGAHGAHAPWERAVSKRSS
jgi:hypothetical protein